MQTIEDKIRILRNKYPELRTLDDLTFSCKLPESEEDFLNEYFEQRVKDEGLV